MEQKLYSEKAMERIKTPEELDKYIRVTKPGVFLVLAMVLILIGAFTYWLIFGSLPTYMTGAGVAYHDQVISLIPLADKDKVKKGQEVSVHVGQEVITAKVLSVGNQAVDEKMLDEELPQGWDEYLKAEGWNVGVRIDAALRDYTLCEVYIVTDKIRPYKLIMK